jgi:hypothetical protein
MLNHERYPECLSLAKDISLQNEWTVQIPVLGSLLHIQMLFTLIDKFSYHPCDLLIKFKAPMFWMLRYHSINK